MPKNRFFCFLFPLTCFLLSLVKFSALAAPFEYPMDVAIDKDGKIYVADQEAHCVFAISENTKTSVLAKGKSTYRSPLYRVRAIVLDKQGQVVVADPGSSEVYRISEDGKVMPLAGGKILKPVDVVMNKEGDLIVTDLELSLIYKISKDGSVQQITKVDTPRAVAVDNDNTLVVISNRDLVKVAAAGKVEKITPKDAFEYPNSVAINYATGEYIVSDGYAKAVWKVSKDGKVTALAKGEPLKNPQGVAVSDKGEVLVADPHAKAIFRISADGKVNAVVKAD